MCRQICDKDASALKVSSCNEYSATDEDEIMSTHSDLPSGRGFRRNDRFRSSLPVVGTPNKSREQPLGEI